MIDRRLVGEVATQHGIPLVVARRVVLAVLAEVADDLRRGAAALDVSPALGTAARVLLVRLGYASLRVRGHGRQPPPAAEP